MDASSIEKQQLVAFRTYMPAWGSERTIWMDGRPHPPDYAEHTFQGFSTGVWEGNMLTITTTHLKTNYYRRNGVPSSDKRTVTEHWTRHGEFLTVVTVVDDPVFLTEPLVRSQNWFNDLGQPLPAFNCEYATEVPGAQKVPNHLPGTQPVPDRGRRLVRPAARSHARRRRDDVSRVPAEDGRAAQQAAGSLPALLRLQRRLLLRRQPAAPARGNVFVGAAFGGRGGTRS